MFDLCTSGAVYPRKTAVHAVYMPPAKKPRRPAPAAQDPQKRRWRTNQIATWRIDRGLTQQQVADRLTELGFEYDRVSVGRVEKGHQNPPIIVLEAIAKIVQAPSVTAMTDYTPRQWEAIQVFIDAGEALRTRTLRVLRAFQADD